MRSQRFLGSVVGAALACAASAGIGGGYVYKGPDGMAFLRITQVGSRLSGFMQIVRVDYSGNDGTTARTAEFVGSVSGSAFQLQGDSISRLFGGGIRQTSGTVRGKGLRLSFPSGSGLVATPDFLRCTEAEWNRKVAAFSENHRLRCQQAWLVKKANERIASDARRRELLNSSLEQWNDELIELSKDLSESKDAVGKCDEELSRLGTKIEAAQKRHDQAERTVKALEKEYEADPSQANLDHLEQARSEALDLNQAVIDLGVERIGVENDRTQAKFEADRIQVRIKEKASQIEIGRTELYVIEAELKAVANATPRLTKSIRDGVVSVAALRPGAVVRNYPDERALGLASPPLSSYAYLNMGDGWSLIQGPTHEVRWIKTQSLLNAKVVRTHP